MTPCKFQLDATGEVILIYSEDRTTVYAQSHESEYVLLMAQRLGLAPLGKAFAMAEMAGNGNIVLGENIPDQNF